MNQFLLTFLILAFGLLTLLPEARAQAPAATVVTVDGVEYVPVREAWRKYKFKSVQSNEAGYHYASEKFTVSFKTGRQDFCVNKFHYVLSYPIIERNGEPYISVIDVEKLVDPVLAPKYSGRKVTTVVLDPGHGGHDSGAVSAWAREKDCNLQLALLVRKKLLAAGYRVVMTRDGDYFLTLQQRVAIANNTPDCIFVSIHHNSGRSAAHGIETFTLAPHGTTSPFARTRRTEDLSGNNQDSENIALATAIHSRAILSTKAVDRGIQRARFSVLCTIKCPAVLFEAGFVSNPEEGRLITTPEYREKLADSICEGIRSFCSVVCNQNSGLRPTPSRRSAGSGSLGGGNKGSGQSGSGRSGGKNTPQQPSRSSVNSRYSDRRTLR